MINILKKGMYLGLGVFSVTKEKVEDLVDELIKKGELIKDDRTKMIQDFLTKAEEQEKAVVNRLQDEVKKAVTRLDLASKEDLKRLEKKIDNLTRK